MVRIRSGFALCNFFWNKVQQLRMRYPILYISVKCCVTIVFLKLPPLFISIVFCIFKDHTRGFRNCVYFSYVSDIDKLAIVKIA